MTLSSGDLRSYEGHGYDGLWYRQVARMGFLLAASVGNTMDKSKKRPRIDMRSLHEFTDHGRV